MRSGRRLCSHTSRCTSPARSARASPSARVFFFQAEDGIRYELVTGVQTCALPIPWARAVGGTRGALTVVSGADCAQAVARAQVGPRIDHITTAGVAALALLEGRKLPG